MAESLREQLLKSGLAKPKPRNEQHKGTGKGKGPKGQGRANKGQGQAKKSGRGSEMDLAKAYGMRAQAEAEQRRREQREAEERARERRELKRKLNEALQGNILNKADAELMRHFEYGGKIRRVHVDDAQMAAINRGELGVIQQAGRYYLVTREQAEHIASFAAHHVALLVDPDAADEDDGVPDDLVW
ncbi:DUF2058 family protein [Oleiagrimonas sp. C23AA]|uniref:DUF2058 family protein n=1 Tax=Oleiagrimonas sp. C23AA TaxID=2719047 RepID=UPI0014220468|nr:DUF2058 family protein [Oleiagrimonas sp. C23AA]NII10383.1 DUF2058 domain-containing protein [Oleiagrimonas sp. C23AA]